MESIIKSLSSIYSKFRIHFYVQVFSRIDSGKNSLTTVETLSMECIQALGNPTIAEFAKMMNISAPNAAYRVNSLQEKGYIDRTRSKEDQREYHIKPTSKYNSIYRANLSYIKKLDERCKERFSEEDLKKLGEMLTIIDKELIPELNTDQYRKKDGKKSF
ncbi:MarR family winged helix-turn-helix transcriptional regulator [Butyrivibrio sp. MC2013]|uniref:MarR family winged helix-turn-helix transcriptional regulator n=1 Tax=Butyrivibrio sp. MC2013 TaxID=1280686 RepID=UPI000422D2F5|nr:MarR family transcriptional regulator [Butyrivibrio sp. MC2013]